MSQAFDNRPPYFVPADDSRDRLIRVEENLKHIDKTLQVGLQDIRTILEQQIKSHAKDYKETSGRIEALEKQMLGCASKEEVEADRKRLDSIFVLTRILKFIGLPTFVYLCYALITKFGM